MWTDVIVLFEPPVDDDLRLLSRREPFCIDRDSPYEDLPTPKVCLGSISHAISLHPMVARSVIRSKKDQLATIL